MTFPGFTIPAGAWLPEEFIQLLPHIKTKSELLVTIVAIYEVMRVQQSSTPISLSDFQGLTGLDRKSVLRGINSALERGTIHRSPQAGTYLYTLSTRPASSTTPPVSVTMPPIGGSMPPIRGTEPPNGGTTPPHVVYACETSDPTLKDQHATSGTMPPLDLIREMRDLGVALKVANNIAGKYDAAYIILKLRHTRHARDIGLAKNPPGWFVASIKHDWPAPLNYKEEDHLTEEEKRLQYISGEYSHLIRH
jgi:hypothetical protein